MYFDLKNGVFKRSICFESLKGGNYFENPFFISADRL
jgi:hypothetical protein